MTFKPHDVVISVHYDKEGSLIYDELFIIISILPRSRLVVFSLVDNKEYLGFESEFILVTRRCE